MKKRILSLLLSLTLALGIAVPASADTVDSVWNDEFSVLFTVTQNFHADWGLYNDQYYIMTITGYRGSDTSIVLPSVDANGEAIQAVYDDAFKDNTDLISVTIPSGITSIGRAAFSGCTSLKSVTIPESVVRIGDNAFGGCNSLTGITLPSGLVEVPRAAFISCKSLTNVVIPGGVSGIGDQAFSNCTSLTSITIPASVTSIGYGAFMECAKLTDVYYEGTAAQWAAITINDNQDYNAPLLNANIHFGSEAPATVGGFSDVTADAYYAEPVQWAVEKGITNGTSATTFSPDQTCTRAQIITFLWRAAGSPEPAGSNPFSDVEAGSYYDKATAWAAEQGMASGTAFAPDAPCTRAMAVEFMWKQAGSPSASGGTAFTDVASGASYAQAVGWALAQGVTTGTSAATFSPEDTCTRGQIVTFLWRGAQG